MHEPGQESHRCAETDASDSRQPINDSRQMASGSRLPAARQPHHNAASVSIRSAYDAKQARPRRPRPRTTTAKTHGSHRATGIAQHTSDLVAIRTVGLIALARIGLVVAPHYRTVRAVAGTTFGPSGNRNRIGFGDIRIRLERYGNLRRISGSGEIVIERELVGGKRHVAMPAGIVAHDLEIMVGIDGIAT